jgi:hypothetical protein
VFSGRLMMSDPADFSLTFFRPERPLAPQGEV